MKGAQKNGRPAMGATARRHSGHKKSGKKESDESERSKQKNTKHEKMMSNRTRSQIVARTKLVSNCQGHLGST